jgi:protein-tyrosine phosphatase
MKTLADHGYPTDHVAAEVSEFHLRADLLLALDSGHYDVLRDMLEHQGLEPDRVRMFRSFDPVADDDLDVPDPYHGGHQGFVEVLATIEAAVPGLLEWIRRQLPPTMHVAVSSDRWSFGAVVAGAAVVSPRDRFAAP